MKRVFLLNAVIFLIFLSLPVSAQDKPAGSKEQRKELGNLVMENIPDIPPRISEKVFQYQNTRGAALAGWLPGGRGILIGTRFGETSQVHHVERPGGARKQLTFFPEPISDVEVPENQNFGLFLFSKDIGGGEFYQIFSFDMNTGDYKMLTDGKSRNSSMTWSNKGDVFVFSSTKRNGKDNDIWLMDLGGKRNELLVQEGGEWGPVDWSADDSKLIVSRFVSVNESYLYIYDLASKRLEQINPLSQNIAYSGALWTKDGRGIYIISDEGGEFQQLRYYDLSSKKTSLITKDINWDIESMDITERGDRLAFVANEDGISRLYMMDTRTNTYRAVPGLPAGQIPIIRFNNEGDRLGLTISTAKTPGDVYSLNLGDFSMERWTYSEVGGLNPERFVEPQLIHYPTFDQVNGKQRTIPVFVYKPKKGSGPYPVLINIHGGPEGQFLPSFSSFQQYLINEMGICVIGPNVRGSTGYGKTYLTLDNGFKREESVRDIGALLDWIKTQPDLDTNRICVYGGSYGGYMVLASMVHYNRRLRCGVDIVGISSFVTFLENTQAYRRDLRRAEYGDERDPKMREFLNKIAPLNQADKITKPMFVVQGQNDPRVPVTEAEQIVAKIRENKGKVWYLMAKDEGHGFQKKSNRDFLTNATILFLEENLLK